MRCPGTRDPEHTARPGGMGSASDLPPAAVRRPAGRSLPQCDQRRRPAGRVAGGRPGAARQGGDRRVRPARPEWRFLAVAVRRHPRLTGRAAAAGVAPGPAGRRRSTPWPTRRRATRPEPARSRRPSWLATTPPPGSPPPTSAADLGWADVLDLGDLTAARGPEMYIPLGDASTVRSAARASTSGRPLSPPPPGSGLGSRMNTASTMAPKLTTAATRNARLSPSFSAVSSGRTGLDQRRGPGRHDRHQGRGPGGAGDLLQGGHHRAAVGVGYAVRVQRGGERRTEQAGQAEHHQHVQPDEHPDGRRRVHRAEPSHGEGQHRRPPVVSALGP